MIVAESGSEATLPSWVKTAAHPSIGTAMEIAYVAIVVGDPSAVENVFKQHLRLTRAEVEFRGARVPAFQVPLGRPEQVAAKIPEFRGRTQSGEN